MVIESDAARESGYLSNIKTAVEAINAALQASGITQAQLEAIKTAVEVIDNFISGSRGLVTEDNSAAIKTAVEVIDNFISGSRGLVTEDSASAIKTAVELIDDTIYTKDTGTPSKGLLMLLSDGTNPRALAGGTDGQAYIQGAIADHAADTGNPLKVGGKYVLTQPTLHDGDRSNLYVDVNGNTKVVVPTDKTINVLEQAPLDAQVLDELLLNAVTATGSSAYIYVLDRKDLTMTVLTSGTVSGTLTFEGSYDQTNFVALGFISPDGTIQTSITLSTVGTFMYGIVNSRPKYIRVSLVRTNGTFSVWLTGGT